jgi:hypothetical protein
LAVFQTICKVVGAQNSICIFDPKETIHMESGDEKINGQKYCKWNKTAF